MGRRRGPVRHGRVHKKGRGRMRGRGKFGKKLGKFAKGAVSAAKKGYKFYQDNKSTIDAARKAITGKGRMRGRGCKSCS